MSEKNEEIVLKPQPLDVKVTLSLDVVERALDAMGRVPIIQVGTFRCHGCGCADFGDGPHGTGCWAMRLHEATEGLAYVLHILRKVTP